MKRYSFIVLTFVLFYSCNSNPKGENGTQLSSEKSIDSLSTNDTAYKYVEIFKGKLICADCPGIITEIKFINDNLTYHETDTYLERNVTNRLNGSYTTDRGYKKDEDATVYVLDDNKPGHERWFLKLNDSTILMLDNKEEIIDTTSSYKIYRIK